MLCFKLADKKSCKKRDFEDSQNEFADRLSKTPNLWYLYTESKPALRIRNQVESLIGSPMREIFISKMNTSEYEKGGAAIRLNCGAVSLGRS